MRIVITGASGNVGTALLRRMRDAHQLIGVSRRRPDAEPYRHLTWVEIDVASDDAEGALTTAFHGADAVVHTAWMIQPSHDRELMRRTNQRGTRAVAAAAAAARVPQLVHLSSIGAYSPAYVGQVATEGWSTAGVSSSPYSVDKAAAERILDDYGSQLTITRMRPTLILQPEAASEIARYFLGRLVPSRLVRPSVLRLTPWPRDLTLQFVHADDVAAAIDTVLTQRAAGAFNVAAEPVVDRAAFAETFGRVGPAGPPRLLRAAAAASWRLRLQPTDPGWIDLAMALPVLDTSRLRALGWSPAQPGTEVLADFVAALGAGRGGTGPLLYPRGVKSARAG